MALTRRQRSIKLNLRSEGVAVEAFAAATLSLSLILHLGVAVSLASGAALAVLVASAVQTFRLTARWREEPGVNLLGFDPYDPHRHEEDDAEDDEPDTLIGWIMVVLAMPFIAAWVIIQILILYIVPTVIVTTCALIAESPHPLRILGVGALTLAIAAANEYAIVRPVMSQHGIPLE